MREKALLHRFPLVMAGVLIMPAILFAQSGLSHVRVVRLSYISGTVAVKRPASTEWAKAQVNTPIQEGFEVATSAHSYAEVEFENGSTARLGEVSKLAFDQLAINESGDKQNRLTLEQGYGTFHLLPEHHDLYSLKIAGATLAPNGKAEFRTDLAQDRVRVEVFGGSVEVATASKTIKLGKDKTLEFDPGATEIALNAKSGIEKDAWDKWTSQRDTQAQLAVADQGVSTRGPMYGWSDLDVYGEWGFFPGFGYGWSPYAAAGWSPYSMGMWSWYPGMGYTWIGGEPWGWLPYHYGNWDFSPGFGWFWMPGSFGSFSPALVSWYSGPGWIGWAPQGVFRGAMVNTVPGSTVQNGLAILPQNVSRVPASAGIRIRQMPFEPGAGAMLSGAPLSSASFASRADGLHVSAPTSIVMGGDPRQEMALAAGHSAREPLRVRLGTTLGGKYAVGGRAGEFRGEAFAGGAGPRGANGSSSPQFARGSGGGAGGPMFVPHGQHAADAGEGRGAPMMAPSGSGSSTSSSASSTASSSAAHSSSGSSGGGHH